MQNHPIYSYFSTKTHPHKFDPPVRTGQPGSFNRKDNDFCLSWRFPSNHSEWEHLFSTIHVGHWVLTPLQSSPQPRENMRKTMTELTTPNILTMMMRHSSKKTTPSARSTIEFLRNQLFPLPRRWLIADIPWG